jgi:hypothetical protein
MEVVKMKYPKPLIYRQLTKSEIAKIKEDLPLSQENLAIIDLIFTSKKPITELAKLVTRSRESLNVLRQRAWAKFIEQRPKPEGWKRISIELPEDEADKLWKEAIERKNLELLRAHNRGAAW